MKSMIFLTMVFLTSIMIYKCSSKDGKNISTFTVVIDTAAFVPETAVVKKGTDIVWNNEDNKFAHSVVSGTPDQPDHLFGSNFLRKGEKYSHIFMKTGEFPYYCSVHPWFMHGMIIVK